MKEDKPRILTQYLLTYLKVDRPGVERATC